MSPQRPLLAESGSQNFVLLAILTSALRSKAAIKLELAKEAANDPKGTFNISVYRTDLDPSLVRFHRIFGFRKL